MNTITSRRNFLKSFIPDAISRTVSNLKFNELTPGGWKSLGHFTAHPPNTDISVTVEGCEILVKSCREGIRAMKINDEKFLELKMKNDGHLFVNLDETWPEDSALSILTGERQQLIKGENL